ncbi:MAG: glycosyltransferase family 4 protein [Acidobacteria bacterium]|nr:glycosyltransferase family 4 protein [Acidobacteriota bacterium]
MRIGVNALYLIPGGVGGTETYLRALLGALAEIDRANEYFVFTNRETGADLVPAAPNFHGEPQAVRAVNRPARLLWEQTRLPAAARRLRLDVMFNPGFTSPLICGRPQATVFHDLQHKRHPEYFRWFDLPAWNFFLYWSVRVARILVAVSAATAADLERYYGVGRKVRVVPHGVAAEFFAIGARRRPEPFVLAVSTLHPHKNLDGLLRAFAIFRKARPGYRLIVTGLHGFFTEPLRALRDELGLAESVDFPGWIPAADLHDLYARAAAFVYPSRFEGFGMPVLEALAAGVPSACSRVEPLDSLAGEAALKFDPDNIVEMAACLERLVSDDGLRARLADAGPARARGFTWRAAAEHTLAAILEAVQ